MSNSKNNKEIASMLTAASNANQMLTEIDARLNELDRCFPYLDNNEFYVQRKDYLEKRKEEILKNIASLAEQYEGFEL